MRRDLLHALTEWLAAGDRQMGEVLIRARKPGFELRHAADANLEDLREESARQLPLYTAAGEYRPLKTAPDLRRGWRLTCAGVQEVRAALDLIYPAMLGVWLDFQRGQLTSLPLRTTLGRQSGMYAVTKKLTDEQAQQLIGRVCRSDGGCLKSILWRIADGVPITSLPEMKFDSTRNQAADQRVPAWPMLCHEGCNLLVAKAREVVKGE